MNEASKNCSESKIEKMIMNLHKDKKLKDGLNRQCKICRKKYYKENSARIKK